MTMLSFRVSGEEVAALERWVEALGTDRSELLRDALHEHLVRLSAEHDAESLAQTPLTAQELSISSIADWGPAEDWSDWSHAAR